MSFDIKEFDKSYLVHMDYYCNVHYARDFPYGTLKEFLELRDYREVIINHIMIAKNYTEINMNISAKVKNFPVTRKLTFYLTKKDKWKITVL